MLLALYIIMSLLYFIIKKHLVLKKYKSCKKVSLKYDCSKYIDVFCTVFVALLWTRFLNEDFVNAITLIGALCVFAIFSSFSKTYFCVDEKIIIGYNGSIGIVEDVKIYKDKNKICFYLKNCDVKNFRTIKREQFENLLVQIKCKK